jgi:methyltransferase OMS1, mitochondrial
MRLENVFKPLSVFYHLVTSKSLLIDGIATSKESWHHRTNKIDVQRRRDVLHHFISPLIVGGSIITETQVLSPKTCCALTPIEAEQKYDSYASTYDQLDGGDAASLLGIFEARKLIIQQARGKVLEVGVGTGLNLNLYVASQISSLTLVDISDGMLQETMTKVMTLPNLQNIQVNVVKADMTSQLVELFGTESFDTVIDTFSMCVLGEEGVLRCLDQLGSVVRTRQNGGQVLLLENARSLIPFVGLYQDASANIVAKLGGKGCVYNQDIGRLIRSIGRLSIVDETEFATGLFRSFRCERNF